MCFGGSNRSHSPAPLPPPRGLVTKVESHKETVADRCPLLSNPASPRGPLAREEGLGKFSCKSQYSVTSPAETPLLTCSSVPLSRPSCVYMCVCACEGGASWAVGVGCVITGPPVMMDCHPQSSLSPLRTQCYLRHPGSIFSRFGFFSRGNFGEFSLRYLGSLLLSLAGLFLFPSFSSLFLFSFLFPAS